MCRHHRVQAGRILGRFLVGPFEFFIALLSAIASIPVLLGWGPPSIADELPRWLQTLWGIELLVGGIMVSYGIAVEKRRTERRGLMLFGPAFLVYGIAILSFNGPVGFLPMLTYVGLSAASFLRLYALKLEDQRDELEKGRYE